MAEEATGVVAEPTAAVEPTTTGNADPGIAEQTAATEAQPPVSTDASAGEDLQDDFPDDPSKQKEAFIKMRQEIRDLRRGQQPKPQETQPEPELDEGPPAFDLRVPPPIQYNPQDLNDPVTAARIEAANATREAKLAAAQLEDMEAESRFPQLAKRSGEYNPTFAKQVQRAYTHEVVQAELSGKPRPRLASVAATVAREMNVTQQRVQKASMEQAQQQLADKEAAALEARGSSIQYEPPATKPDRTHAIRRGSIDALADDLMDGEMQKYSAKDLGFTE